LIVGARPAAEVVWRLPIALGRRSGSMRNASAHWSVVNPEGGETCAIELHAAIAQKIPPSIFSRKSMDAVVRRGHDVENPREKHRKTHNSCG
jgi:hypothetical protein